LSGVNWFTGIVLFVMIWWTALFAVLPVGTKAVQQPDDKSGWRGAPERPRILRKVIVTTVVASMLWTGSYLLVRSDYISFRHGFLAAPDN
jgi:predicted secreted protein